MEELIATLKEKYAMQVTSIDQVSKSEINVTAKSDTNPEELAQNLKNHFVELADELTIAKINVFDAFIEGAKEGFWTCVKIIPYLVGMLIAISLLRTSGVFDVIIDGMKWIANAANLDARFVDGLPTALIKPLSGSGARGMMVDTMATFGADSFQGKLAAVLQGSSDTTFYVIAVYFGAVAVKNTRYTVIAMLLADLVGVITAIGLAYLFFA